MREILMGTGAVWVGDRCAHRGLWQVLVLVILVLTSSLSGHLGRWCLSLNLAKDKHMADAKENPMLIFVRAHS